MSGRIAYSFPVATSTNPVTFEKRMNELGILTCGIGVSLLVLSGKEIRASPPNGGSIISWVLASVGQLCTHANRAQ